MKKSRFTESQIAAILKEGEAGVAVAQLARKRGISDGVLSAYLFDSQDEMREITGEWLNRYNEIRSHDALGSLPPARYRERLLAAANSSLELSTWRGSLRDQCIYRELDS